MWAVTQRALPLVVRERGGSKHNLIPNSLSKSNQIPSTVLGPDFSLIATQAD